MTNVVSYPIRNKKSHDNDDHTSSINEVLYELKDIRELFWDIYLLLHDKYRNDFYETTLSNLKWLTACFSNVSSYYTSIGVMGWLSPEEYESMNLSAELFTQLKSELEKMKHLTEDICSGVVDDNLQQKIKEWEDLRTRILVFYNDLILDPLIITEVTWSVNLGLS